MTISGRSAFPRAALAIAGVLAAITPGTLYAKKEKAPVYELGQPFRTAALPVQTALDMGDSAAARVRIAALEALAQTPAEKYALGALRLQLGAKLSDPQAQRKALTMMLESGGAPPSELPYLRYLAGYFSYTLNELNDAQAQLNYAQQLGYKSPQLTLMLADAHLRTQRNVEGFALLTQAIAQQQAAGGTVDPAWYDRATAFSYKAKDWANLALWSRQKLTAYPARENWRTAVVNYMDNLALTPAMKLDLYRLLAAQGALASERDYQAYADLAAKNEQYSEAKAVIEGARASGKLLATDTATGAILKTASVRAAKERAALTAKAGKAGGATEAANGYFAMGDYTKAAELYRKALSETPADPGLVNTRLGVALARAGDGAGARQILSSVTGPWTDVAQFWLLWATQKSVAPPPSS